jgi:hypothetical protein
VDAAIQRAEQASEGNGTPAPFVPPVRVGGQAAPYVPPTRTDAETVQRAIEQAEQPTPARLVGRVSGNAPVPVQRQPEATPRPDLFQAMAAAGMVDVPSVSERDNAPSAQDIALQRSAAIQRAENLDSSAKPDLFQAMMAAGMVKPPSAAPPESDAPRIAMSVPVELPNAPVQRGIEGGVLPESTFNDEPTDPLEGIDLDKLSEDVYRALRDKLRILQDRRLK